MKRRRSAGFSLLEVLIALVILSFGLLGAVAMQTAAIRSNKEARLNAVAATLARHMADRIRDNVLLADKVAAADNPYILEATLTALTAMPSTNCFQAVCSDPIDIAKWDVAEWKNMAYNMLPSPKLKICYDDTPFDSTTNKAQWACTDSGKTAVVKMAWTRASTNESLEFASAAPYLVMPVVAGGK